MAMASESFDRKSLSLRVLVSRLAPLRRMTADLLGEIVGLVPPVLAEMARLFAVGVIVNQVVVHRLFRTILSSLARRVLHDHGSREIQRGGHFVRLGQPALHRSSTTGSQSLFRDQMASDTLEFACSLLRYERFPRVPAVSCFQPRIHVL